MSKVIAPWTDEQVIWLNRWQADDFVHEFTCPNSDRHPSRALVATTEGWRCTTCGYTQNWAHDFMMKIRG